MGCNIDLSGSDSAIGKLGAAEQKHIIQHGKMLWTEELQVINSHACISAYLTLTAAVNIDIDRHN